MDLGESLTTKTQSALFRCYKQPDPVARLNPYVPTSGFYRTYFVLTSMERAIKDSCYNAITTGGRLVRPR